MLCIYYLFIMLSHPAIWMERWINGIPLEVCYSSRLLVHFIFKLPYCRFWGYASCSIYYCYKSFQNVEAETLTIMSSESQRGFIWETLAWRLSCNCNQTVVGARQWWAEAEGAGQASLSLPAISVLLRVHEHRIVWASSECDSLEAAGLLIGYLKALRVIIPVRPA